MNRFLSIALGMFLASHAFAETFVTVRLCDENGNFCKLACMSTSSGQSQSGACPASAANAGGLVNGFKYSLSSGIFAGVETPPVSLGFGPVQLIAEGAGFSEVLNPGDIFDFISNGLNNVSSFSLEGIIPVLDEGAPGFESAFPVTLFFGAGQTELLSLTALAVAATPIPEPATFFLVGAGLAGLLYRHRRKRAQRLNLAWMT